MSGLLALVLAFSDPGAFLAPADLGGGGGNHFTGSPSSHFDCTVCHDRASDLKLEVASDPSGLFDKGYTPGQRYTLTFSLSDKGKVAGFGAELDTRGGAATGSFTLVPADGDFVCLDGPNDAPGTDPVALFPAGDVATGVAAALACKNSPRSWRVSWAAPATDVGAVNLFASAVAGNLDGSNRGDRAASLVMGVPSPSTAGARAKGCASAPGALAPLALLLVLLLLRGRAREAPPRSGRAARGGTSQRGAVPSSGASRHLLPRGEGMVLVLVLLASVAWAAPKKKKHPTHHPPATRPAPVQASPPLEPAPAPAPEAAPEPVPEPAATATPAPAPAAPTPPAAPASAPPPGLSEPADELPAVHAGVQLGYGYRDLRLTSPSFATPLRAQLGFPLVGVVMGFEPMRLLRVGVLEGLELEGAYVRGWVLGPTPLGGAQVLPADGWVALGYAFTLGRVSLAPRALYRVQVGGAEKNFSFDDAYDQSVGGELRLGLEVGRLSILLAPRGAVVLDSGTLAVEGYGAQRGGLSLGGEAALDFDLGAGFTLGARYGLDRITTSWAGGGKRALGAVSRTDLVQTGALTLRLAR